MAAPPLFTQADLEIAVGGPLRLAQLCCDNGSGIAEPTTVTKIIQRASDHAAGILISAFTIDQIVLLAQRDEAVKGAIADVGAGYVGRRKTEFMNPETGRYPFDSLFTTAIATLKDVRAGNQRAAAEETVGKNRTLGARVKLRPRPRVFANNKGGF